MATAARQRYWQALAFGALYLLFACAAIKLTRFHGGVAFISVANALLLARLLTLRKGLWGPHLVTCAAASMIATAAVGLGIAAAPFMAPINVAEAWIAAAIMSHLSKHRSGLGSRVPLHAFLLVAGIAAPMISAVGGAAVATALGSDTYLGNWSNWFAGHALGLLTFTPIITYLLRGDARAWFASARPTQIFELAGHLVMVSSVVALVFSQEQRPLLFLPMLPIILATFRIGRLAAACTLVILVAIGGGLTIGGHGPISGMAGSAGQKVQFLQFYLACTMITILPIAAELARRASLHRRLHDSEARYRLLAENSTDIVLNLDVDGAIRFASPSIRQIGGYDAADVVGRNARELVDPTDTDKVAAAHVAALSDPSRTFIVEYRAPIADGSTRWFETHTRAVLDDAGLVTGVVSAIRDVTHRKAVEAELSQAAMTDKLTGIANRRALEIQFERATEANDDSGGGCLALFDLDHFKSVNDRHGHAAGDLVLRRFADLARSLLREGDMIARYGGEEFVVLLPDASIEQARLVCDRLRMAMDAAVVLVDGAGIKASVSGGVVPYMAGAILNDVVAGADAALYRAKREGRNRLALAA